MFSSDNDDDDEEDLSDDDDDAGGRPRRDKLVTKYPSNAALFFPIF